MDDVRLHPAVGPASLSHPPTWPGGPAPAIAGCVVFALLLFMPAILNDGDTLWQVRTGEWILSHGAIPHTDPFSFTAGGRRWFAHEWGAEVLLALAFRVGGMAGVMALAAGATGLTAALLLHYLRRFLPGIYAVTGLVLALTNAGPSLLARPHLLAWPCLVLWVGGLVVARARHRPPSFLLLPVMLAWVNLHGSFMLGLLLPGLFAMEALLDPAARRVPDLVRWAGFIMASWATALLNPDGLEGVLFPFHMLGMTSLRWIGEWEPTSFTGFHPLELILLGGLALGFSGRVTLPPIRLIMLLGLLHGALTHVRNEQLLGLVGALVLAEPLGASLQHGGAARLGAAWRRLAAGAALAAAVALAVRMTIPLGPDRTGAAFAATLDAVPPALRARPVLNGYEFGGALIFQGVRPFIDSRADLFGDAFLGHFHRIIGGDRPALVEALADYGIAWTIFLPDDRLAAIMDDLPGWRRLAVTTPGAVIHVRDGGP